MSRFAQAIISFVTNAKQTAGEVAQVDKEVKDLGGGVKEASKGFNELKETAAKFAGLAGAVAAVSTGIALGIDSILNRKSDLQSELDELNRGLLDTSDRLAKLTQNANAPASGKSIAAPLIEAGNAINEAGNKAQGSIALLGSAFRFMGQRLVDDMLGTNWVNGLRETEAATQVAMNRVATIAAREAKALREREAAEAKRAAEEDQKKRTQAAQKEVEDATIAQLSGAERVTAEEQRALAKIAERRKEAKSEEERDAIDALARLTAADAARRRQDIVAAKVAAEQKARDEAAAQTKAAEEAAKKIADAFAKEVTAGIARISDAQRSASAAQLTGISTEVTRIGDLISARLRSVGNGA